MTAPMKFPKSAHVAHPDRRRPRRPSRSRDGRPERRRHVDARARPSTSGPGTRTRRGRWPSRARRRRADGCARMKSLPPVSPTSRGYLLVASDVLTHGAPHTLEGGRGAREVDATQVRAGQDRVAHGGSIHPAAYVDDAVRQARLRAAGAIPLYQALWAAVFDPRLPQHHVAHEGRRHPRQVHADGREVEGRSPRTRSHPAGGSPSCSTSVPGLLLGCSDSGAASAKWTLKRRKSMASARRVDLRLVRRLRLAQHGGGIEKNGPGNAWPAAPRRAGRWPHGPTKGIRAHSGQARAAASIAFVDLRLAALVDVREHVRLSGAAGRPRTSCRCGRPRRRSRTGSRSARPASPRAASAEPGARTSPARTRVEPR